MKRIVGVDYRHKLVTAYVKIVGRTEMSTEREAKRVARWLQEQLPEASVVALRSKAYDPTHKGYITIIPILIAPCEKRAKAIIGKAVLQGDLLD